MNADDLRRDTAQRMLTMTLALAWNAEVPNLLTASVHTAPGRPLVHLVAESMEGGSWGWAAWSNRSFGESALCGSEQSRRKAMKKAELAARMILVAQVLTAA